VCLHSFDDPKFLKDTFNTMMDQATSLKSRDRGVTPVIVVGIAKCMRSVSDIVAKDYWQYILENEETVSTSQTAAYHKAYARGFILKITSVQVVHALSLTFLQPAGYRCPTTV
jgi:hypothetical protein